MKKRFLMGGLLFGGILLIAGLYYTCVKAGIPYQDPTPEMTAQYERNEGIGIALSLVGSGIELLCLIIVIVYIVRKKILKH